MTPYHTITGFSGARSVTVQLITSESARSSASCSDGEEARHQVDPMF